MVKRYHKNGALAVRVGSIDSARFLAISLVFYGHLVEQVMYLGSAAQPPRTLSGVWAHSHGYRSYGCLGV